MPNNDSHQHVVKTSAQWNERIVEFWVVPRGCLCVELTSKGKTKIKIGEGDKYYSQLPYICNEDDLSQYYTKEEVNNLFDNFNRMAIMSTDEYDRRADLPMTGNKLGDVRFVKSSSPSVTIDPDIYLWNGRKWIYVGNQFPEIDLNKYLKKTEFHELFDPVKERVDDIGPKVDEMYPMRHTHANKDILDNTTASYTSEEKTKLAGLHNYDAEISDLQSKSHTHDNKSFLDTITQEYQIWSQEDRYKFDHIKNYDQDIAEIRVDIQTLESKAHTHANKNILDQVTAAFTIEDKTKLDSLHNDTPFVGTDGMYPGVEGNVPAPLTTDVGKFLSSDGTWKLISEASDFIGATDATDGYHGLVPAPLAGEETYFLKGDGTWSEIEIQKYAPGIGISFTENPDKFYEIEYLEYDGRERLNTGVKVISGHQKAYIKWMWINNANGLCLFADCHPNYYVNSDLWMGARGGSSNFNVEYGGSNNWIYDARALRTIYEDEVETLHRVYHRMNDETYETINAFCDPQDQVYLFGQNIPTGTAFYGMRRIYAFKLWDNDVLKLDMVPVRRVDGVLGMYDKVSGTFKTIEHPENLSAGPDSGRIIGDSDLIVNDGVIDITQDNMSSLNELTVHFSAITKTLTIPTYTLQPATTTTLGGIKVGDNLTIDQDGVLSAAEYIAGDGISFVGIPEYTNMNFSMSQFITSINQGWVAQGTKSTTSSTITLTNTSSQGYNAYTGPYDDTSPTVYTINVSPNTEYELRYTVNGTSYNGGVTVFENRNSYNVRYNCMIGESSSLTQIHRFTTTATATTLNFRVDVITQYGSITFSNIQLYELSYPPSTPRSINAKLGMGLSFDANGAIEAIPYTLPTASASTLGGVIVGDGLEIDEEGVLSAPGGKTYVAGTGIEIGGSIIYNRDRRIPSEIYRQVEYIESDGAGYIMTDIVPTSNTWYQFRYRGSNDSTYPTGAVFGSTAIIDGQYRDSQAFFEYYDNALKTCMMCGSGSGYGYYVSSTYPSIFGHDMVVNIGNGNMNLYSVYTCEYAGNGSFRNDTKLEDVGTSNTNKDNNTQPLAIFGVNTYDITNDIRTVENRRGGRFYYLNKMEGALDDSLMTHYLRPCYRLSDERYGVYDVKNSVFYPVNDNAGFTVGNDLVDIEPVEGDVISAKIGKGLSIDPLYGNIVNSGVVDVIQDETQQNKLTVKFINSQKDIVIPSGTGGEYTAGDGIDIDQNNIINAELGIGLTFDVNDAIELDDTIKIRLNCNNEPD